MWRLPQLLVPLAAALGCGRAPVCATPPRPFHAIAHRGASAYAPENTLPAFRRALELGASEVELDVQLSRDGVLVLFHDATLDAKTDRSGRVRDWTAAELRETEIGRWFDASHPEATERFEGTKLDTLSGIFETFGPSLHYHVEIKAEDRDIPRLLLRDISEFRLEKHVTITSFHRAQLERVRALDAAVPIHWLLREPTLEALDAATGAGFQGVAVAVRALTRELVAGARARGLEIRAWQIRSDADMERAIRLGSDGMTTNWPDRLIRLLECGAGGPGP